MRSEAWQGNSKFTARTKKSTHDHPSCPSVLSGISYGGGSAAPAALCIALFSLTYGTNQKAGLRGTARPSGNRMQTSHYISLRLSFIFASLRERFLSVLKSLALFYRHILTRAGADIHLARARNFLFGVRQHFLPLCQPPDRPRNRKQDGKIGPGNP